MKKNSSSARSLKFIQRNNPENLKVKEYIKNLSEKYFEINFYEFINFKEQLSYKISVDEKDLILFFDKNDVELKLFQDEILIEKFYNDSCWYQGLKFIKENFLKQ